jgi:antitoxin VapB
MGIFIKNPRVEQKARELADLTGQTLTSAVEQAVDHALAVEKAKPRGRPTLEEMRAATVKFRKAVGLDKVKLSVTKADFDAMWEIPGLNTDFDPE